MARSKKILAADDAAPIPDAKAPRREKDERTLSGPQALN